jgi:hypothetical protein
MRKLEEIKFYKIKHFEHLLWVTIIFIFKKRLYGNYKERKKEKGENKIK